MFNSSLKAWSAFFFVLVTLGTVALFLFPTRRNSPRAREVYQTRIIIPQSPSPGAAGTDTEQAVREEGMKTRLALENGETLISVLTGSFDDDPAEEQIVAYRNLLENESPVYLAYIEYDEARREYKRIWNAPTAASRPDTISLYTQDLLGDRSVCVLLSGMNGEGDHTLTVFNLVKGEGGPFRKIVEIRIDGTISVRETSRPQAYQLGMARGQSFAIAAYGRDFESANILDQIEILYAYNPAAGRYEQSKITRLTGTQIERRKLQAVLNGKAGAFEDFITGLWYYVSPQGTLDNRQYIYFDPANRELIFYMDETQQVFHWQNSSVTRYGLYISSRNISVTTLRRFLDLELESLDSIRAKVFEDVRLKIGVNAPWDGSYRRAVPPANSGRANSPASFYINAVYDGSLGKIRFAKDGSYEHNLGNNQRKGKYAFFFLGGKELLEFRSGGGNNPVREIYLVESGENPAESGENGEEGRPRENMILRRARLGARGIQELREGAIFLSLSGD